MKDSVILKEGKILIYPTDTIWGIGCSALNTPAIEKIKTIKGRDNTKSLILLVKDIEMLCGYVEYLPKCAIDLINNATEPTTIVYPKAKNLPIQHLSFNESIAIRIPKNDYLQQLFMEIDFPIVSTSANFSGSPSPQCFADIDRELLQKVDYVSTYHRESTETKTSSSIYLVEDNDTFKKIR